MASADMEKLGYTVMQVPVYAALLIWAVFVSKCSAYMWAGSITVAITMTLALPRRVFPTNAYFLIQWALLVLTVVSSLSATIVACHCDGGKEVCYGTPLLLVYLLGAISVRGGIIVEEWNDNTYPPGPESA